MILSLVAAASLVLSGAGAPATPRSDSTLAVRPVIAPAPVAAPVSVPTTAPAPVGSPSGAPIVRTAPRIELRSSRAFSADSIVVEKRAHRLTLFAGGLPVRTYDIALGPKAVEGPKSSKGDNRTPEGLYQIDARNPNSRYHLGLHVSYPNDADRARARSLGVEPGGDIMVHGLPNGQGAAGPFHLQDDWTNGCMAVTDQEIEEIWRAVPVGTPIRILP